MAAEILRLIEEKLDTDPNDPHKKILLSTAKEMKKYLIAQALASKLNNVYGDLPDETELTKLFPKHFRISPYTGTVTRGPYYGMTKEDILAGFPQWNSLYQEAKGREKNIMGGVPWIIHSQLISSGISTLGDLRSVGNELLEGLSKNPEAQSSIVVRFGLANAGKAQS